MGDYLAHGIHDASLFFFKLQVIENSFSWVSDAREDTIQCLFGLHNVWAGRACPGWTQAGLDTILVFKLKRDECFSCYCCRWGSATFFLILNTTPCFWISSIFNRPVGRVYDQLLAAEILGGLSVVCIRTGGSHRCTGWRNGVSLIGIIIGEL
jgi:hypothetical protein